MNSAALHAGAVTGLLRFPDTVVGRTEASTTRRADAPHAQPRVRHVVRSGARP